MKKYKAIAFDLDDTLLDTSALLVPKASQQACQSMIDWGLHCDLQTCTELRLQMANQFSHPEIFRRLVAQFGCDHPEEAIQSAIQKFYNPEIPLALAPMPDALENLRYLKGHYALFLVTMGSPESQKKKVQALGLADYFQRIFFINGMKNESKKQAFEEILKSQNLQPSELLSIGNRLSTEIRDAKLCGCDTCYFAHGEHLGEKPQQPADHPDFTIRQHSELISTCHL